jgi:membrane protease YdiL (CAAX protease family)
VWGNLPAFAVSALLFSLAHSLAATQGLIGLLVPAFVMGLILAWGMQRTGSLVPCVIAHAMNNGLALSALLVCVNSPGLCPAV